MGIPQELGRNTHRLFERALPKDLHEGLGVIGIGDDTVPVSDILTLGQRNVETLFTESERAYCERAKSPHLTAQRLAARFAAKEAVVKAIGGTDAWDWQEISIEGTERGVPLVKLSGSARLRAEALGVEFIHVTLEHKPDHGTAACVVIGKHGSINTLDTSQLS